MTSQDASPPRRGLAGTFSKVTAPTIAEARANLWSPEADGEHWSGPPDAYYSTLLEQYKLYVEMADRVSARRGLANTFFLTFNSAVFTLIGAFWTARPHATSALLIVPVLVLLAQCLAWFWLIRSYRQLNAAKYAVVGALEERLPASRTGGPSGRRSEKARIHPGTCRSLISRSGSRCCSPLHTSAASSRFWLRDCVAIADEYAHCGVLWLRHAGRQP